MKKSIQTCLSPELIYLYEAEDVVSVVIDVLRATSTIAALISMDAERVIPVSSVEECIQIGDELGCITAGERNGKIIPGLQKGNSPLDYTPTEVANKTIAITTTNGTMLLHELVLHNAKHIITGAFVNLSAVCEHIIAQNKSVLLACAGWKGLVNCEDSLFAGAVAYQLNHYFNDMCDSSIMVKELYEKSLQQGSIYDYMNKKETSHFKRLSNVGHQNDLEECCQIDRYPCLPYYTRGGLVRF